MARVILGWEYGAGFGHVAMLMPLARSLHAIGHTPILALKNPDALPPDFERDRIQVIRTPDQPAADFKSESVEVESLADPLIGLGFDRPDHLQRLAATWDPVLREVKPDVAVIDFAPILATCLMGRVPIVGIGTGYSVPPLRRRLVPIRPWVEKLSDAAEARLDRLQDSLAAVAARRGGRVPLVSDIFTGDRSAVCTIHLLDPYRNRRGARTMGPLSVPPTLERRPADPPYGFAYLAGDAVNIRQILEALERSPIPFQAFVRHLHPTLRARFAGSRLTLHDAPQDLLAHMAAASLIIHHGGLATTHEALWMGTPQIIVPKTLEQSVTARAVAGQRLGQAVSARLVDKPEVLVSLIEGITGDAGLVERAGTFAGDFRTGCPHGALGSVLHMVDLFADGRGTDERPTVRPGDGA